MLLVSDRFRFRRIYIMTKKRVFSLFFILMILIVVVVGFVCNHNSNTKSAYHPEGSAGNIAGTTIIVSLFADDTESNWDNTEDVEKILIQIFNPTLNKQNKDPNEKQINELRTALMKELSVSR